MLLFVIDMGCAESKTVISTHAPPLRVFSTAPIILMGERGFFPMPLRCTRTLYRSVHPLVLYNFNDNNDKRTQVSVHVHVHVVCMY